MSNLESKIATLKQIDTTYPSVGSLELSLARESLGELSIGSQAYRVANFIDCMEAVSEYMHRILPALNLFEAEDPLVPAALVSIVYKIGQLVRENGNNLNDYWYMPVTEVSYFWGARLANIFNPDANLNFTDRLEAFSKLHSEVKEMISGARDFQGLKQQERQGA